VDCSWRCLELIKGRVVIAEQPEIYGEIWMRLAPPETAEAGQSSEATTASRVRTTRGRRCRSDDVQYTDKCRPRVVLAERWSR